MTTYLPTIGALAPPAVKGPKLVYAIGDLCWVFAGLRTEDGKHIFSPGKVVFWFDLVDEANRLYVIRIISRDFMHYMTRDALVMSPTPLADGFPFMRTHNDELSRPEPHATDWRAS